MNKHVINTYLNRELDDWDWLKTTPKEEIIDEIRHYYKDFEPGTAYNHQLPCILLGILNPQFNFFLDMGLGKTFVVLNLIKYWKRKALVLVPNEVNVMTWEVEISKFTNFKAVGVSGSTKQKIKLLRGDGDIFICNYYGFLCIFTKRVKKRKKTVSIIDEIKIRFLLKKFGIVIYDELHKLGNMEALITQLCDAIQANIRYGLTGTPFGKSPEKLWSEFKVIDNGETLGVDERLFKAAYFTKSFNYWGQLEYKFKEKLSDHLHQTIKNKSITYTTEECVDLPKLNEYVIEIPLSSEGKKYYTQSHKQLVASLKEGEKAIDSSFVRLRSICAGYLYFKNEEDKKTKSDLLKNPKLDYLIEMLSDIDDKVLVFNEYTLTGDLIAARFKKEKIPYKRLYGATKNKKDVLKQFENNNDKVLLLNSETGGTGGNLQYCKYAIFYETTTKPDSKKQCIKRIHRIGQDKITFLYDLVMKGTLEEDIMESLEDGEDLYQKIIRGKKCIK